MSSFFSDDEDSSRSDARPTRGRTGRAPPRLARHLRPNDAPIPANNAHASSSTLPSSPRGGDTSFFNNDRESSDVTGMTMFDIDPEPRGKSRRLADLDTAALFGGTGDVPLLDNIDTGGGDLPEGEESDEESINDVTRLIKAWVRERGTPDLMTWQGDLVEECLHKLGQQATMLELLRSDPKTSEEEHFKLIIVQTEMERVKYLVRAYLRCRLAKVRRIATPLVLISKLCTPSLQVEKFAQYITTTPEAQRLLSQLELSHAQKFVTSHLLNHLPADALRHRYTHLMYTHYTDSVLQSLPEKLRGLEVDFGTHRSMGTSRLRKRKQHILTDPPPPPPPGPRT